MSFIKQHKIKFIILGFIYILYFVVCFYGPQGYQIVGVGGISKVADVIKIEQPTQTESEEVKGDIYTVGLPVFNNPPLIIHFLAKFDHKVAVEKINSKFTNKEDSEYSSLLYDEALNSSVVAAYTAAEVEITYDVEVRIALALSKGKNAKFPYPVKVESIDGVNISDVKGFRALVAAKTEITCREDLNVRYTNESGVTTTDVLVGDWEDTKCTYGILVQDHITNIEVTDPQFKYTIDRPEMVGGNSGGLMQALKVYNELMRKKNPSFDLIKKRTIAGTGTIDIHGNVGAIGGAYQKLYSVNYAQVDVFFILEDSGQPTANYDDARAAFDELEKSGKRHKFEFVPVKTLQDAIDFLSGGTR